MKIKRSLPMLACILLHSFILHAETDLTLRVGYYDNPPKIYMDSFGDETGIFPDILAYIAEKEHWNIEWIPGTWNQCLENLETGSIDVMVDVAYSLDRDDKYDFSTEAVFLNWAVVYKSPEAAIESLMDMDKKTIAVMKGSIHTEGDEGIKNLVSKYNLSVQFIEVKNYEEVFELIDQKKVDAGVVNRLYGSLFSQSYNIVETPILFNPRHIKFAFPTDGDNTESLKDTIDRYLYDLKKDPGSEYYRILNYYFFDVPKEWIHREENQAADRVNLTVEEKQWIQEHPVIRIGIDPEFFPFEYIDQEGRYSGIASDYVQILNSYFRKV